MMRTVRPPVPKDGTMISTVADRCSYVARTVAEPGATAVTSPVDETVATSAREVSQVAWLVTARCVPSDIVAVAVSCLVSDTSVNVAEPVTANDVTDGATGGAGTAGEGTDDGPDGPSDSSRLQPVAAATESRSRITGYRQLVEVSRVI